MQTPDQEKIAGIPAAKAKEIIENNKNTAEANRVPFPGPAREAFTAPAYIEVGTHKVRPFYDGDFDILEALEHPLHKMAFGDEGWGSSLQTLRGQMAWDLCHLLTTTLEETQNLLDSEGSVKAFQKAAKAKFSKCQLGELIEVQRACFLQFNQYFSTVIGFESDDGSKKKQS